jgi:hypothetical protein
MIDIIEKILAKKDDFILSSLSKMIVNRDLLKIKLTSGKEELQPLKERFARK